MKNLFILSCLTFFLISCSTDEDDVNQGPNNFQIETIEHVVSFQIVINGGIPYDVWSFSSMNTTDFQLDQNGNYTYNDPGFVIATLTYIDGVSSIATTNGTYGLNAEFNNFNFSSPNTHCATATVKIFLDNNLIQTDTYIVGVDSWVDASTPIWCQSDVADFYVSSSYYINFNN